MSEDSQKTPRRRRSRRPNKRSGRSSGNAEVSNSQQPRSERPAQPRRRRTTRSQSTENDSPRSPKLVVQTEDRNSLEVSRINRDIFIYTYTLFPRSYLDSYQAGPGVAERMDYED